MNDKDKEAFEKWWVAERGADDFPEGRAIVVKERQLYEWEEQAWQSACEYKQKEIDELNKAVEFFASENTHYFENLEKLQAENTELEIKLWQALGTMGYPVPGHIPEGDYKCGLCSSREVQIIRKDAHQEALLEVIRILSSNKSA